MRDRAEPFADPQKALIPTVQTRISRPLQFAGLDYGGPMIVTFDSERIKIWICLLYTCLTSGAVPLDFVKSLSPEIFLNCFDVLPRVEEPRALYAL
ncbi:unnamed protein product, partial [Enterobius vermicularis]|uniref:Uncharacterized protein n=1 Tax=Enterobius vermicularis TaxID=51028 RepID=A0A0N4VBX8_ENTVE